MVIKFTNAFNTNIKVGDKVIFELEKVRSQWFTDAIFKLMTLDGDLIASLYAYQNQWCGNNYTVYDYEVICKSTNYFISAIIGFGNKDKFDVVVQPTKEGMRPYVDHVRNAEGDFSSFRTLTLGLFSYYNDKKELVLRGFKNGKEAPTVLDFSETKIITGSQKFWNTINGSHDAYYIEGIATRAFMNNTSIKQIKSSLTYLGKECFKNCGRLEKIEVFTHLCHYRAFENCSLLKELSGVILFISDEAFKNCINLKDVTIGVEYIGDRAFMNCSNLVNVKLCEVYYRASATRRSGENFVWLGESSFEGCSNLTTIDLTNSNVSIISKRTFANCKNLKTILLPKAVNYIDAEAFLNCESLEEICFPGGVFQINKNAFANCINLRTVKFGREIINISSGAFENCKSLTNISLLYYSYGKSIKNDDATFEECLKR